MGSLNILVVDDEPGIRELIRDVLAQHGHNITCAENGNQAISLLRTGNVDVAYLDIRMPNGDGLMVLREIKAKWPLMPVIMITGCPQHEVVDESMELGASACLIKPFGVNEVIGMLEVVRVGC